MKINIIVIMKLKSIHLHRGRISPYSRIPMGDRKRRFVPYWCVLCYVDKDVGIIRSGWTLGVTVLLNRRQNLSWFELIRIEGDLDGLIRVNSQ